MDRSDIPVKDVASDEDIIMNLCWENKQLKEEIESLQKTLDNIMKPIVEIKKIKGYVPVVDEKKYVLDEIVYRRDGEDTWNNLLTEEVAMVRHNNDGEKSSLIQENEKLRSALECIAEVGSEIEGGDATQLGKDMHRIAIDAFKNIKPVSFLEEENIKYHNSLLCLYNVVKCLKLNEQSFANTNLEFRDLFRVMNNAEKMLREENCN